MQQVKADKETNIHMVQSSPHRLHAGPKGEITEATGNGPHNPVVPSASCITGQPKTILPNVIQHEHMPSPIKYSYKKNADPESH